MVYQGNFSYAPGSVWNVDDPQGGRRVARSSWQQVDDEMLEQRRRAAQLKRWKEITEGVRCDLG